MSKDKRKSKAANEQSANTFEAGEPTISETTFEELVSERQVESIKTDVDHAPNAGERFAFGTLDYSWLLSCAGITLLAAFLRFWQLALKPMHHDEGVNGFFLRSLFYDGVYKYDPSNYHGPTLYYIALAFTKLFGLETYAVRASVGVFGVLTVILIFFLRKYLGTIGTLSAALLVALAPGMVFISRYFIHEIFFVFCSLGIVLGVLFFIEGRRAGVFAAAWMALLLAVCFLSPVLMMANFVAEDNPTVQLILRVAFVAIEAGLVFFIIRALLAWNDGRPIYLLLAAASASLLFATKETAFITLGTLLIACPCVWLWRKIRASSFGEIKPDDTIREPAEIGWTAFRANLGEGRDLYYLLAGCALVFIYVGVVFFSSFFSYWEGVGKAFEAYAVWTKTGKGEHVNGWFAYVKWLWKAEAIILILSAAGFIIALARARHRFAIFTAFWALGLFIAYTIIPYKTPWLALSFVLPMCLVAGYGINELAASRDQFQKGFAWLLMAVAVGILGYKTYDLNFVRYDDDSMPYVYAHTRRGFLDLANQINHYAEKSGKGNDATIEIVSPDYWSMPWYTRFYSHANYWSRIVPASTSEMIVAKKGEQDADVLREYAAHYKYIGTYPLRPGVDLYLLVRNDLADAGAQDIETAIKPPGVAP